MTEGKNQVDREGTSEDINGDLTELLREISELRESLNLDRSRNQDTDSKCLLFFTLQVYQPFCSGDCVQG